MRERTAFLLFLILFLVGFDPLWATTCNSWWGDETCLTVHSDLDLGTIDSSSYCGATPDGGGAFQPLVLLDNAVDVVRNGWLNLSWILEVRVSSASGIDPSCLCWRRSDTAGDYLPFSGFGDWMEVAAGRGATETTSLLIDYEYLPATTDPPGDYAIILNYRVTVSWGSYQLYAVYQDVTLYLHVEEWIVIALHSSIDLGTIDGSGYVMGSGLPPCDALGNGVFIVSNSPTGWDISLQAGSIATPPCYSSDLLSVFFWEIDNSEFHPASALAIQPVIVASSNSPGMAQHSLGYRYTPTTAECGGDYSITLIYTATAR